MAEGEQAAVTANPEVGGGAGAVTAGAVAAPPAQPANAAADPGNEDEPLTELEMVSMERDDYRRKLEAVQAELAALTGASSNADTINKLQQDNDHLRKTLKKATDMLREKMTCCHVQEKKNAALNQQVTTLKEVLQVTRDLLNIRNMEVEQLQKNVDSMEARINDNRKRQTAMIKQMEQATKINGQLRSEYETQLQIFQSLKERYEEKVTALTNLANERQRHNSEGSEKFEDAPDTADGSESANATEQGSVTPTNSTAESSIAVKTTTNDLEVDSQVPPERENTSQESSTDMNTLQQATIDGNTLQQATTDVNTLKEAATTDVNALQEATIDTNTAQDAANDKNVLQDAAPANAEAL